MFRIGSVVNSQQGGCGFGVKDSYFLCEWLRMGILLISKNSNLADGNSADI